MATDNETVAEVCSVLYTYPKAEVCDGSGLTVLTNNKIADHILAAHKREIAKKDDERLTIVANYENVIAAKDAEIAELRKLLASAAGYACTLCGMRATTMCGGCNVYRAQEILEGGAE